MPASQQRARLRDRFRRVPESAEVEPPCAEVEPPYPEPEVITPTDDAPLPEIVPETPT